MDEETPTVLYSFVFFVIGICSFLIQIFIYFGIKYEETLKGICEAKIFMEE